jgi:hypothetical protein
MSEADEPNGDATWLDYCRLFRLPNIFTAIADVAMGFLFVHPDLAPWGTVACLVGASCLLYTAGMVLNDVYDADYDALERPERPIPSGHIPRGRARAWGLGMLLGGVAVGWLAGLTSAPEAAFAWRPGAVATILAACVLAYDTGLKDTLLGPLAMGACRFLNVLLGMSLGAAVGDGWQLVGYSGPQLLVAGGIGVYVAGITGFSRQEAEHSRRGALLLAVLTMLAGIGLLGLLHRCLPPEVPRGLQSEGYWLLLLGLLTLTILRRCGTAIAEPSSEQVQAAVKHALQSLIVLDAAVVVEVNGLYYAVAILLLLFPATLLGRWVYST